MGKPGGGGGKGRGWGLGTSSWRRGNRMRNRLTVCGLEGHNNWTVKKDYRFFKQNQIKEMYEKNVNIKHQIFDPKCSKILIEN